MVGIQSAAAEIRRGKKRRKKEERRTNHSMKIYMVSLLHRATINEQIHSLFSAFKIADVRHLGFQYEILTVDRTKFRMSPNQVCVLFKNKAITDLELR